MNKRQKKKRRDWIGHMDLLVKSKEVVVRACKRSMQVRETEIMEQKIINQRLMKIMTLLLEQGGGIAEFLAKEINEADERKCHVTQLDVEGQAGVRFELK